MAGRQNRRKACPPPPYCRKESAAGGEGWRTWSILPDAQGRPEIRRGDGREPLSGLHVSISHSGEAAVAMASFTPCGIDVQHLVQTVLKVREKFASDGEEQGLFCADPELP